NHYVVLYKVKSHNVIKSKGKGFRHSTLRPSTFYISDPAFGLLEYTQEEFLKFWIGNNANETTEEGIALLLEPTPNFHHQTSSIDQEEKVFGFKYLSKYLFKYKSFIIQLAIGLLAGSILQLIFPFLTQSIVDVGIQNQNMHFIWLMLIA